MEQKSHCCKPRLGEDFIKAIKSEMAAEIQNPPKNLFCDHSIIGDRA